MRKEKCEVEGCKNDADCVMQLDSGARVNVCAECLAPSPTAPGETDLEALERLYGKVSDDTRTD